MTHRKSRHDIRSRRITPRSKSQRVQYITDMYNNCYHEHDTSTIAHEKLRQIEENKIIDEEERRQNIIFDRLMDYLDRLLLDQQNI